MRLSAEPVVNVESSEASQAAIAPNLVVITGDGVADEVGSKVELYRGLGAPPSGEQYC